MGKAMMGTGEAEGENRAVAAAEAAISNPLLDDVSMKGARGVLINITGGLDMTLFEVDEAANRIRDEVDPDANIIFGSTFNPSLEGVIRISVVATGIDAEVQQQPRPVSISLVSNRGQVVSAPAAAAVAPTMQPTAVVPAQLQSAVQPGMSHAIGQTAAAPAMASQPLSAQATMHAAQPDSMPPQGGTGTYGAMPEPVARAAAEPARAEEPRREPAAHAEPRPAAARQSERFIAPPPVEASARTASRSAAQGPQTGRSTAQPAQPAAPAAEDKRRGPSLFSRVTGGAAAWARGAAADIREATPGAAMNRLGSAEPRPAVQAPARPAQPAQARLAGLDPRDRIAGTQAEEELLDIPAFLRRQAN
jgi:cell division protein FtsZ